MSLMNQGLVKFAPVMIACSYLFQILVFICVCLMNRYERNFAFLDAVFVTTILYYEFVATVVRIGSVLTMKCQVTVGP